MNETLYPRNFLAIRNVLYFLVQQPGILAGWLFMASDHTQGVFYLSNRYEGSLKPDYCRYPLFTEITLTTVWPMTNLYKSYVFVSTFVLVCVCLYALLNWSAEKKWFSCYLMLSILALLFSSLQLHSTQAKVLALSWPLASVPCTQASSSSSSRRKIQR